ncbi:MAG TPA: bifunctional 4-hydroxy-2-oxoglutarate aldolase/2-dehydro-3-deoxy-phosphogluconate aldolase [Pedococcus sp.]|jgi:2-dehydro-3-deoxyphosphogluconate aldolase/(4S)-4-hydroxy-2-oxoglutarate aldolase|nr:bifunctional 4-hydroxy-2-oxoglutarate aldolase/2-dehydro-3-deoxy-phosphogluconate aldolase [Pedococcus sp.]
MPRTDFLGHLTEARLMAIVRAPDADGAVRAALAICDAGVRLVEISLTTPGALDAIARLRSEAPPEVWVGAGTVLTARDVTDVLAAGAGFVVTPALAESVDAAVAAGVPVAAGAFTPSEVVAALQRGADVVKVFPASILGPGYLRALRDPFPGVPFMAVGGVGADAARDFLAAGAVAVGVGGPLLGDAATGGDLAALRGRAQELIHATSGTT